MRAALALLPTLLFAVPGVAETSHEAFIRDLKEESRRADTHRYDRFRPSDVAECRSRGNAAFGDIVTKTAVMEDCLRARELRRQGR